MKISKSRKRTAKNLRSGIRKQLGYVGRNLRTIDEMLKTGELSAKDRELLQVLQTVYQQQEKMYAEHTHSVENRIVSISQPYIRPIPRGKAKAKT